MERIGIIDIGSNSVKLFVGEKCADGTIKTVIDENDIVRLGEGLESTGRISDAALERNAQTVAGYVKKAEEYKASQIICFATMAVREASNSDDFIARVKDLSGEEINIISGDEEARLEYLAVLSSMPVPGSDLLIFDIGGGSTEFIYGRGTKLLKRFSLNLGTIRITETFFTEDPVAPGSVRAALSQIERELAKAGVSRGPSDVIGMGGTVTTMGAVKHRMEKYGPGLLQGSTLTISDIDEQIASYSERTIEQRKTLPGLSPKRADVILAGACIVKGITDRLSVEKITISDRSARHGLAYELFFGKDGSVS